MSPVRVVGVLAAALVLAGCAAGGSDDAATTPSSSATPTSALAPMTPAPPPVGQPMPFRDYLASINVAGTPIRFDQAPGLTVTTPTPDGWARTADPMFATGIDFVQPVDVEGTYPSITLMAIKLDGDFDPKDAITHANTDALPPNATNVVESYDDYQGFPSAAAEGVVGDAQHYSRIVLATVPSNNQRYLVQLSATTLTDQPIGPWREMTSIVSGFTVAVS